MDSSDSPLHDSEVFTEASSFTKESPCPNLFRGILSYTPVDDYLCPSPQ